MTNKFRGLEPLEPGQSPSKSPTMGLDGGYRGDLSPRQIPLNSAVEVMDVRFERSSIRRDFGWTAVGAAAAFPIRAILEHKYIDGNQSFHRLIRIFINGTDNAVLEVWDGAAWVLTDTSTEIVLDVYLSAVSALGCAYFADGQQVLEWCEVLEKFPQEDDFPNGNSMTLAGQTIQATIDPGSATPLDYEINYDVEILSSSGQDTTITLEFVHNGVVIGEREYFASTLAVFPVQFFNEVFSFTRQVSLNDTISIRVKDAVGGGLSTHNNFLNTIGPAPQDFTGDKIPATTPASDDRYTFIYNISGVASDTTVAVYIDDGAGFILVGQQVHSSDELDAELTVFRAGVDDPNARFGIDVISGPGSVIDVQVEWTSSNANFEVHGHNKSLQGDDPAGVTYETTGAVVSQFQAIDPGPGGRFLFFFARRLVVLRNFGDTQTMTWSQDGIANVFIGAGSGEIILVDTRSDPIDDLMGGAVLSSNFAALFRKRSIMRVFETGISDPALGAVPWIEDLGTNSPFSIKNVKGGVMFLGHDLMVYFLTEQGPTPVGGPIHQDLIEELTQDLDLVDTGWDPTLQEFYLGVPVLDSGEIVRAWVFDVQKFLAEQRIVWRRRAMTVQRFSARGVSEIE